MVFFILLKSNGPCSIYPIACQHRDYTSHHPTLSTDVGSTPEYLARALIPVRQVKWWLHRLSCLAERGFREQRSDEDVDDHGEDDEEVHQCRGRVLGAREVDGGGGADGEGEDEEYDDDGGLGHFIGHFCWRMYGMYEQFLWVSFARPRGKTSQWGGGFYGGD